MARIARQRKDYNKILRTYLVVVFQKKRMTSWTGPYRRRRCALRTYMYVHADIYIDMHARAYM